MRVAGEGTDRVEAAWIRSIPERGPEDRIVQSPEPSRYAPEATDELDAERSDQHGLEQSLDGSRPPELREEKLLRERFVERSAVAAERNRIGANDGPRRRGEKAGWPRVPPHRRGEKLDVFLGARWKEWLV
jgi:hypothetical protein